MAGKQVPLRKEDGQNLLMDLDHTDKSSVAFELVSGSLRVDFNPEPASHVRAPGIIESELDGAHG